MELFYFVVFGALGAVVAALELSKNSKDRINTSSAFNSFKNNYLVVYSLMMAGDWLQGPYVYYLYSTYGFGKGEIGQLFIAGFGSSMLFGTIVGSLADKQGRRRACVTYCITYMLSCITKHSPQYKILMVGRVLGGIATSLLFSAFESWLVAEHNKRGFEQQWLSLTFSKAIFLGNGLVAILAGLFGNVLVDSLSLGPVAPFDAAAIFLAIGMAIILSSWTENFGDPSENKDLLTQFRGAAVAIASDEKIALLGAIQSLFEGSMYTFVFLWTPALSPNDEEIPHGGLGSKDVYLAYLPLAHILELAAENLIPAVGGIIGYGTPLTLTDTSNKIKRGTKGDATVLSPTVMAAVPAILDRVRDGVRKKVDAKGGLAKKLFDLAYSRRLSAINGSWFGAWGLEKFLWDFLVFKKVRAVLGGRIRFLLSGGAPLSADTQRFINICLGAPIGQGYGLTETCAGATFSEVDDTSIGRVGSPLPCSFVKLVDWPEGGYLISDSPMPRGEIVVGGPSVTLGYFKNEEKTKEVYKVDERGMRWFYTGDVGQFHADGCLEIIDRKKDIVKLQHGEYVSLGKVEAALSISPYVDNIMLHADPFHSYCVALVVASQHAVEDWASKQGVAFTDFAELCEKEETIKEVLSSLVQIGKKAGLEKFEIPAKIKLLSTPWTPESGLVTAALKIKREAIRKAFSEDLAKLYT